MIVFYYYIYIYIFLCYIGYCMERSGTSHSVALYAYLFVYRRMILCQLRKNTELLSICL